MSIVAYDGKSLAADRQMTRGNFKFEVRKIRRINSYVLAWTGYMSSGLAMAHWFENGALRGDFPACQQNNELWARLIVVSKDEVVYYEQTPHAIGVYAPYMAWGQGSDFAMGAMSHGATAKEAVEIACRFDTGCGFGVDVETL